MLMSAWACTISCTLYLLRVYDRGGGLSPHTLRTPTDYTCSCVSTGVRRTLTPPQPHGPWPQGDLRGKHPNITLWYCGKKRGGQNISNKTKNMVRFYYIDENMFNVHVYTYTFSYIKSRRSQVSKINLFMDDD